MTGSTRSAPNWSAVTARAKRPSTACWGPDRRRTMARSGFESESDPPVEPESPEHADFLDVGSFIRSQREKAKLSVRRLAELADVSNPYLSQVERGLRRPSAEILQQVAHALRISVESLYVRAGILSGD